MRKLLIFCLVILSLKGLVAQDNNNLKLIEGKVEYISSQFIYVKFENTNGLNSGDTLLIKRNDKYIPKLIIESLSSRSCATKSINGKLKISDKVFSFINSSKAHKKTAGNEFSKSAELQNSVVRVDTSEFKGLKKYNQDIYGRFSISSYSNISNISGNVDYQNWRYSLSFNANNINNSKFSFSNYITFRYRADEWNYVSSNLGKALKIYDLAVKYNINSTSNLLFGRKINRKVANLGAIDGLQFETVSNKFTLGGIIGSRPDYVDYGVNSKLLEFGGYLNRTDSLGNGVMENTISLFQQMNDFYTDRRFLYFQHTNNILAKTSVFVSSEMDLYEKKNNKNSNSLRFTSLYLSLRYSPFRWLSTSLSYDARKNVIYYETFKNYVDQLAESALRQGFRLRINLRPIKYVFVSAYSGYRFRDTDVKPTRNFGGSLTHSRIPYLDLSANISFINLATNYLDGNIFGLRISKDLIDGLIYSTFGYRKVNYTFNTTEYNLNQDIFQLDLSFRISKKYMLSLDYEGTFEKRTSFSNIYINFTTRF